MRRSLLAVAVFTAVLPIAACGGSDTPSGTGSATSAPAAGGANDEQVQWVDKVCGEILTLTEAQTTPPDLQGNDAAQALAAFDTYLDNNITVVDDTINGLKDVGDSPVDGGDEAVNALVTGLEQLKAGYETTKSKFAGIDASDPAAAQNAMIEAFAGLSAGGEEFGKALEGVESNQAIEEAGNKAPNCQKLDGAATEPTPTT